MLSQKNLELQRIFRTGSQSETLNRALINMNWVEVDCYKAFYELISIAD